MSELHAISKPEDAKADVVFIHGLGGDPFSTWQQDPKDPENAWPHWQAAAVPHVAVHTLAYAASPHNWLGPSLPLGETAENLLGVLVAAKGVGSRPLVLVGHSMGGLVIKQILRTVSDRKDVKPWQPVGSAVKSVVSLGTPHRGAKLATYLERIGRYFEISPATADLRRHGEVLIGLNDWYAANAGDKGIATHCFYETEPTAAYGLSKMIVEKDSGDIDIADVPSYPMPTDHMQICKPPDRADSRVGYLIQVVEDVLEGSPSAPVQAPPGDRAEDRRGTVQTARTRGDSNVTPQIQGDGNVINVTVNAPSPGLNEAPASFDTEAAKGAPAIDTLPTSDGGFIGREADMAAIRRALLAGGAAVTAVEGMGGIGKTVTGLQVAYALRDEGAFPDGALFVDLHGFSEDRPPLSAGEALTSLLRQIVGSEPKLPDEASELQQAWRQVTAGKRMLLLLDNAQDGEQIKPLLPGHPDCRVLTTSRNRFTLPDLRPIELGLLNDDEAINLALARANQRWERLDREQAARLAARCGRHPLAIEVTASALAAARSLNVDQQLEKLGNPERSALDMDQVKAVLLLSLDLLEPEERAAWKRLGVFEGDFDADAAKAVMDAENADAILATLETRHLVTWQENDRLHLHDILRAIALEDLDPTEREVAGERHSRHYKDVLAKADELYTSGEVLDGLRLYDSEQHQILAGQTFAAARTDSSDDIARLAADYANAGAYVLDLRLSRRDHIAWLDIQAEACRKLDDRWGEGAALHNLGVAFAALGAPRRAIEHYERHLVIAREIGDRRGEGNALGCLGLAYADLGEPRRAIEHHEQHLDIAREIGDRRGEGNALGSLGSAYAALGEPHRAIEHHEQYLEIAREIGDRRGEGNALGSLGAAYADHGEPHCAIEYYEQQLEIAREIGHRRGEGNALGNLGLAYAALDEPRRAIEHYEQQLEIAREIGDRQGEARARFNSAGEWKKLGERAKAIDWLRQALAIEEAIEDPTVDQTSTRLAEWTAEEDAG
ncbi:MAG: alpha/beta fold hydrolase [Geminicoccaceae bacterium]